LAIVALVGTCTALAQGASPVGAVDYSGFTSYTTFRGSTNSSGQIFEWNTSVGYNFNRFFGVDVGLPLYYSNPSSTTTTSSGMGAGDAYGDLRLSLPNPVVNYSSKVTIGLPTGNADKGFSTGRATVDWNNHFDHSFGRWTPFAEAGLANTISNVGYFERPFTSLGFVSHFQGGMTVDVARIFQVGGSAYAIEPSGTQKIYSKLVGKQSGAVSAGSSGNAGGFNSAHVVSGGSDLDRDHGYGAFVLCHPVKYMDLDLAYTRSADYQLNTVSFGIGLNLGVLAKTTRH
jgi:hypothetical protein